MYEESRVYTTTTRHEYVPTYGTAVPDFNINLDLSYLQTLPGLLKCLEIAFDFLGFICVLIGGPGYYAGVGWATFVSVFGFIITLTLLMLYLFHVVDSLEQVPWIVGDDLLLFLYEVYIGSSPPGISIQSLGTIFYFIAGSVLAVASVSIPHAIGWTVAAVSITKPGFSLQLSAGIIAAIIKFFAFLALLTYGLDCYLKFLAWKNNEKAVGGMGFIRRSQNV